MNFNSFFFFKINFLFRTFLGVQHLLLSRNKININEESKRNSSMMLLYYEQKVVLQLKCFTVESKFERSTKFHMDQHKDWKQRWVLNYFLFWLNFWWKKCIPSKTFMSGPIDDRIKTNSFKNRLKSFVKMILNLIYLSLWTTSSFLNIAENYSVEEKF